MVVFDSVDGAPGNARAAAVRMREGLPTAQGPKLAGPDAVASLASYVKA